MALLASDEKKTTTTTTTTTQDTQPAQTTQQTTQPAQQTTQQATPSAEKAVSQTPKVQTSTPAPSSYDKAMETLQAATKQAPSFSSDYDETISNLYQRISSREPFTYDYSTDPLYNQYKEQYVQGGQMAMRDTMGQAAALTGGYGSSYGQAVGQQQYDAYLQRLNDVMPDLYRTAYDQYEAEGNQMEQNLQLAGQLRETEYGQFRDAVGDKQYEDAWALQQAEDRAQYGDFSGYKDLYGDDAARAMMLTWAQANPDAAYYNGNITPEEYYNFTGAWPRGYTPPGGGGGGTTRSTSDIIREQLVEGVRNKTFTPEYAASVRTKF